MKVSIVVPSFNQGQYLAQCLDSIFSQKTNLEREVLVLDGGSTDGSVDIIKKYSDRLAFWRSNRDGGQAAAIAEGFARSTGDFLIWMNSDDFFLPGALASLETAIERRPLANFFYGGIVEVDASGAERKARPTAGVNSMTFRYRGMIAYSMASFYRRSLYLRAGPVNAIWRFAMDLDLFLRLLPHARCARLESPHLIAAFRLHDGSKTATLDEVRIRESQQIRELHGAWPAGGLANRSLWHLGWAVTNAYRTAMMCRSGHGKTVIGSIWNELKGGNELSPAFWSSVRLPKWPG